MNKKFNLAIVGATGSVGREISQILEERNFPINELALVASSKSEGKKIRFKIRDINYSTIGIFFGFICVESLTTS